MDQPLRFFLIGAPAMWPSDIDDAATTAYREWAWDAIHRQSLRLLAFVSIINMLLFLR